MQYNDFYNLGGVPEAKFRNPNPGMIIHNYKKATYYVAPSYFFLLDKGPFWQKPFCFISIVLKGDREALEFAEKSMDLGNAMSVILKYMYNFL